jgi:hypothetical protein
MIILATHAPNVEYMMCSWQGVLEHNVLEHNVLEHNLYSNKKLTSNGVCYYNSLFYQLDAQIIYFLF